MSALRHNVETIDAHVIFPKPILERNRGAIGTVAPYDMGGNHLDKLRRDTCLLKQICANAGRRLVIVDVAPFPNNWAAASEYPLVGMTVELLGARSNGVGMNPSFNHQGVGVDRLGDR